METHVSLTHKGGWKHLNDIRYDLMYVLILMIFMIFVLGVQIETQEEIVEELQKQNGYLEQIIKENKNGTNLQK